MTLNFNLEMSVLISVQIWNKYFSSVKTGVTVIKRSTQVVQQEAPHDKLWFQTGNLSLHTHIIWNSVSPIKTADNRKVYDNVVLYLFKLTHHTELMLGYRYWIFYIRLSNTLPDFKAAHQQTILGLENSVGLGIDLFGELR